MTELNTQNPDSITWQSDEITFTILGGIRLEGLDRLRCTLKAEYRDRALRHNLDLYNDTQVEKLIRKAAERLEIGTPYIGRAVAELVNQLEAYRLQQIEQQKKEKKTEAKPLTTEEREAAIRFLKDKNLLSNTNELIEKSGVVGESLNRLLMYLIFTSRKRENPLHIISLGSSGTGKTYLQEKVSELIPEEDKLEITVLSENAFYYFGQQELKHKLILIEDLDGAENVLYPLRELQSKKRINKTVAHKDNRGNTRTVHLRVEGPVSVAGCTTRESVYEDNANRSFLIYLDENEEQDEQIMQRQRLLSAGRIDIDEEQKAKTLLRNCQKILQPLTIKNPFAEKLKIPQEVFKPRRTNAHYLQFIEVITFYHQYQREEKHDELTGEVFIETTIADIEEANTLMKEILLRKSDELNKATRTYFEYMKAFLKSEGKIQFTAKEIRQALKTNHSNQKRYMLQLLENFYIKKVLDKKPDGRGGRSYVYEVVSYEEYEKLKTNISSVLDGILENLKKNLSEATVVYSPNTVHNTNEPRYATTDNGKTTKVQKFTKRSKRPNLNDILITEPITTNNQ